MKLSKTKERLSLIGIYALLTMSTIGSVTGTLAWYQYRSRAETSFHGTALNNVNAIQIGLKTDLVLDDAEDYGLSKDPTENIYWADNGVSSQTLTYFLSASGYATNALVPTTSGKYASGDVFNLRMRPTNLESNIGISAFHDEYVYLPLAFRTVSSFDNVTNFKVKILDSSISSLGNIKEAIRVHFDNGSDSFVYAPGRALDGLTAVGGGLDIELDGYVDYSNNTMKEYPYGEFESLVYETTPHAYEEITHEHHNCFNGVHAEGVYAISDESIPSTAQYLGRTSVLNKRYIAYSDVSGIAYCNTTIYLEGWDQGCIDEIIGTLFNLNLSFELEEIDE